MATIDGEQGNHFVWLEEDTDAAVNIDETGQHGAGGNPGEPIPEEDSCIVIDRSFGGRTEAGLGPNRSASVNFENTIYPPFFRT